MLQLGVHSSLQVSQDPPALSLTPPPTRALHPDRKASHPFHLCIPRTELCLECFLPPLMGSLPSIIYGAYQNTLSPQPSPPTESTKVIFCLPLCLRKTENFASECKSARTVYFTPSYCDALFNLCILYDLNVILSGSAPCYRLLFRIR